MKQIHNEDGAASPVAHEALMRLFELTVRLGEEMEKGLVERGLTRARAAVIWQLHQQGPVTQRTLARPCGSARATSPGCWTPWKPAAT